MRSRSTTGHETVHRLNVIICGTRVVDAICTQRYTEQALVLEPTQAEEDGIIDHFSVSEGGREGARGCR